MKRVIVGVASLLIMASLVAHARSGGGGGNTETIKVSKCEYFVSTGLVEWLVKAASSNTTAHLYVYSDTGAYMGEAQNGGGSKYGGTVMLTIGTYVPNTVTIISSSGGTTTVTPTVFQP